MNRLLVAFAALCVITTAADAQWATVGPPRGGPTYCYGRCGGDMVHRPAFTRKVVTTRRVIGYRPVTVERPITRTYRRTVLVPTQKPTVPCGGCAVDMHATFVGCIMRDGRQLWQYRTERGIINMTVPRQNEPDMIRALPNGSLVWARK